jgi:thiol-disulfide isomerase/thioredoxin
MYRKFLPVAFITSLAALILLVGCKTKTTTTTEQNRGAAAPEASLAIPTLDGTTTSVDQYKCKVVLVNFWATWCQPCKIEIPWLIEFNHKYGPKGLVILGVAMDDEGKKVVEPWVKSQHFDVDGHPEAMDYTVLLGNDKIASEFGGILGLPTSMVYSRDGKKIKTIVGLISHDEIVKTLDSQL